MPNYLLPSWLLQTSVNSQEANDGESHAQDDEEDFDRYDPNENEECVKAEDLSGNLMDAEANEDVVEEDEGFAEAQEDNEAK